MKPIVFVHPPLSLEKRYGNPVQAGYTEPPSRLCYLAAVTRQRGLQTSIVDTRAFRPMILFFYLSHLTSRPQFKSLLSSGVALLRYIFPDNKRSC